MLYDTYCRALTRSLEKAGGLSKSRTSTRIPINPSRGYYEGEHDRLKLRKDRLLADLGEKMRQLMRQGETDIHGPQKLLVQDYEQQEAELLQAMNFLKLDY